MSTRAVYEFHNLNSKYDNSVVSVYKHHDGYPEGGSFFIKNAKKRCDSRHFDKKNDLTNRDGMVVAFMTHSHNGGSKSFGTAEEHPDIEFLYKIYDNERVEIWNVRSWEGEPNVVFDGSIDDAFEKFYIEIEEEEVGVA
jgi:hypothetical protein